MVVVVVVVVGGGGALTLSESYQIRRCKLQPTLSHDAAILFGFSFYFSVRIDTFSLTDILLISALSFR